MTEGMKMNIFNKNATYLSCLHKVHGKRNNKMYTFTIHRYSDICDANDRLWFVHKYMLYRERYLSGKVHEHDVQRGFSWSHALHRSFPPFCHSIVVEPCRTQIYVCILLFLFVTLFSIYMIRVGFSSMLLLLLLLLVLLVFVC